MTQPMQPPTPAQALLRLATGVHADVADYERLQERLDAQFDAALRHDSGRLAGLADEILALCDTLDVRRQERNGLLRVFAAALKGMPPAEAVTALLARLPESQRSAAQAGWSRLGALVRECKALNVRNGQLLMDQHEIMQRVLKDGDDVYAPA
ncbi:MAG: flagellar export chaperone FlgN [Proteobacteria bacterium]|nr:flagellar export chaperone FlgN [Pseudomonadota bacterium]